MNTILITLLFVQYIFTQVIIPKDQASHGLYLKIDPTGLTKYPMVMGVLKNSPADLLGIKIGQRIFSIDNNSSHAKKLDEIYLELKGKAGKQIKLYLSKRFKQKNGKYYSLVLKDYIGKFGLIYSPAELSRYFHQRFEACINALIDRDTSLKSTKRVVQGENFEWALNKFFMSDTKKGVFRESKDQKFSFLISTMIENLVGKELLEYYFQSLDKAIRKPKNSLFSIRKIDTKSTSLEYEIVRLKDSQKVGLFLSKEVHFSRWKINLILARKN